MSLAMVHGCTDLVAARSWTRLRYPPVAWVSWMDGVADLTVSGDLGLARITAASETEARYTGLKLGNVVVSTKLVAGDFGLTGDLKVDSLSYNDAADGVDRLDWNSAVDFDGDGAFEALNPGSLLTDSADLLIDFESGLQFEVRGSVVGTGSYTTTKFATDQNVTYSEVLLRAGPVVLNGSAQFALSRWTLDVDVNGDGAITGDDLSGAQLDQIALSSGGLGVGIDGVLDSECEW